MKAYMSTHTGLVREQNEDAVRICSADGLYVLADGMGGHRAGEVASAMAVQALEEELRGRERKSESLRQAIERVNAAVYAAQYGSEELGGMGTTLTALWDAGEHVLLGHVGDSRAYLYRDGRLRQVTEDHSVVGQLLREGKITGEQARRHPLRSVITRAIGTEETVCADVLELLKCGGDRYLLCSDGLSDLVEDAQIERELCAPDARRVPERLVKRALACGGRDNVSVLLLEVEA